MELVTRDDIRNIAIIAHVDHGKTTLLDGMLKQSGVFHKQKQVENRVMDTNDLEKERGITILAKNTAIDYKGLKINIVDTPGHADFGGEVERILKMVDGVLLIIDAFEGPMPQTKFVLRKALNLGLQPIVVINKIDRSDARPYEVEDEVLELFIELDASAEQLEFPTIYASGLEGIAKEGLEKNNSNLEPLFQKIVTEIPAPTVDLAAPLQMIVTTIEYNEYVGRLAVGKIKRGKISNGALVSICRSDGSIITDQVSNLYQYSGLGRVEVEEAQAGDIVAISGLNEINIGETIADKEDPEPLPFIEIEKPTVTMTFTTNDSPLAGREGEFLTSRHLQARFDKELESNVALDVAETEKPDVWRVSGRGLLHLSVLIETMRREGYEFQVSKPDVITKQEEGQKLEPIKELVIDIPKRFMGTIMEEIGQRKGQMQDMKHLNAERIRLKFEIPARGLIGFRSDFLTLTKGEGIINHSFSHYDPYQGDLPERQHGSLVATEKGEVTRFGIFRAQERGRIFVKPGAKVYRGMIVGENSRQTDLDINICKQKKLDNMRSGSADEAIDLIPPTELSLEEALNYIAEDEYVEITPKNIRLRKKILNSKQRRRDQKK